MVIEFDREESLSPIQIEAFDAFQTHRNMCLIWGRRAGKSTLCVYLLLTEALKKPNQILYYIAPTSTMAKDILWEMLLQKCEPFTTKVNITRMKITLLNGSAITLKSADGGTTSLRGVALDMVVFDEFAMVRDAEELWQEAVRPSLSDKQGKAVFISTPFGRNFAYTVFMDAIDNPEWFASQKTSIDGGFIPDAEIEVARKELSEHSFQQEYMATFVTNSGLVVPDYDRELNNSSEAILSNDTLICGVDFNKLKMPCCVFVKRGSILHMVDFFFGDFDTEQLMHSLMKKYPKHKMLFHTDASGSAQKTSAGGKTDITIIESFGHKVQNLRKNPNIIDRVNATNSLICSSNGTRKVFFNNSFKMVVETLERHMFAPNGKPDKSHKYYDDVFDSLSYALWHYSKYSGHGIKVKGFRL